jgi:hypothetical protein
VSCTWDKRPTTSRYRPLFRESNLLIFGTAQVSSRKREKKERRKERKKGEKEKKGREEERREREKKGRREEERKIGGLHGIVSWMQN